MLKDSGEFDYTSSNDKDVPLNLLNQTPLSPQPLEGNLSIQLVRAFIIILNNLFFL